jgi:hypothetical protein
MARYRSKLVEIEAVQYLANTSPPGLCACNATIYTHAHGRQGATMVNLNDWLVVEPDGSGYYPCAPDVFERRWEEVKE